MRPRPAEIHPVYLWVSVFIRTELLSHTGWPALSVLTLHYQLLSVSFCACGTANLMHTKVQLCSFWCSRRLLLWKDSSMLHYYAKIIIHTQQQRKMWEPKKLSGLLGTARGGKGWALTVLRGLLIWRGQDERLKKPFFLSEKDESSENWREWRCLDWWRCLFQSLVIHSQS